jgi:hypothetical protein
MLRLLPNSSTCVDVIGKLGGFSINGCRGVGGGVGVAILVVGLLNVGDVHLVVVEVSNVNVAEKLGKNLIGVLVVGVVVLKGIPIGLR